MSLESLKKEYELNKGVAKEGFESHINRAKEALVRNDWRAALTYLERAQEVEKHLSFVGQVLIDIGFHKRHKESRKKK